MPDQSPADLIRTYLGNADRLKLIEEEAKRLKASQKEIPRLLKGALPQLSRHEPLRFFDADAGCLVQVSKNWDYEIEIKVEEPPSLDSLMWPESEPELAPDSADASDRFLAESPSADFELPAVAEVVAACADDVF